MTKTITEFQPLFYQRLFAQPRQRQARRRNRARLAAWSLPALYVALGVKITADTGIAPWHWQFWLMFTPLFILGERVMWSLREQQPVPQRVPITRE